MLAWKNNQSLLRVLMHRIRIEWLARPDEFDRTFGVETRLTVWRKRLSGKPDSVDYEAVNPALFARALPYVPRATFVDLGCGKGRALILAHQAGFREVIGVEIAPRLLRAAKRNTRRLNIPAALALADAATYHFPDRPIVAFLYNPFGTPTLEAVIEKLRGHRHPVHVIYVNPMHDVLFSGFDVLFRDCFLSVLSASPPAL
jgi:SAM-dependent methyltransferase